MDETAPMKGSIVAIWGGVGLSADASRRLSVTEQVTERGETRPRARLVDQP